MNIEFVNSIKEYKRISLAIEYTFDKSDLLMLYVGLLFFEIWVWKK